MRISDRAASAKTAMKPISTPRISASSTARRSKTPSPSAAETASAARLRASFMARSVIRRAPRGLGCYRPETIETNQKGVRTLFLEKGSGASACHVFSERTPKSRAIATQSYIKQRAPREVRHLLEKKGPDPFQSEGM